MVNVVFLTSVILQVVVCISTRISDSFENGVFPYRACGVDDDLVGDEIFYFTQIAFSTGFGVFVDQPSN